MLLYDWNKIFKKANGRASTIFMIVEMLVKASIP